MMNETTISRVNYFDRQFLRRQDFADEQQYHLAMRRRHNIAHHGWGIVSGLTLIFDDGVLFLNAGMAIDGYGRELIQPRRTELPVNTFISEVNEAVDVWLVYDQIHAEPATAGLDATPEDNQTDYYRVYEAPRIMLTPTGWLPVDARKPPQVPEGDFNFAPYQTPSDDPNHTWPVFLGNVRWAKADEPPTISMSGRPMVTAVASQFTAPSGDAAVQLGSDDPAQTTRFAVFSPSTPEDDPAAAPWIELVEKPGSEPDDKSQMELVVRGQAVFHKSVRLKSGQLVFEGSQTKEDENNGFRLYRYSDKHSESAASGSESNTNQPASDDNKTAENPSPQQQQLRVELVKSPRKESQFVIGAWSDEAEEFEPFVTIDSEKNMTVHGNLVVEGRVDEKAVRNPVSFSQDAKNMAQVAALTGMAGSSQLLNKVYRSPFDQQAQDAGELLKSPEALKTFVTSLLKEAKEAQPFFDELMAQPAGQTAVVAEAVGKALNAVLAKLNADQPNALVNTAVSQQAAKAIAALINSESQKENLVEQVVKSLPTEVIADVVNRQQTAVLNALVAKDINSVIAKVIETDLEEAVERALIKSSATVISKTIQTNQDAVISELVKRASEAVISELLQSNADTLINQIINEQPAAVIQQVVSTHPNLVANELLDGKMASVVTSLSGNNGRINNLISALKNSEDQTLIDALLKGLSPDDPKSSNDDPPSGRDEPPFRPGGER